MDDATGPRLGDRSGTPVAMDTGVNGHDDDPAQAKRPLTVDEIVGLFPEEVEDLRPLLDRLIRLSQADESRRWSGSGELGTIGERLVDPTVLEREIPAILSRVSDHLTAVYGAMSRALCLVSEHRPEDALGAFLEAAEHEQEMGRPDRAEAYVGAAVRLAGRVHDRRKAIHVFLRGARVARGRGRWSVSDARYREALGIARDGDRPDLAARAAVGRGNLAIDRGRWRDALRWYEEAEGFLGEGLEEAAERWHIPLNRSIVFREQGRLDLAERELDRATERAGALGDGTATPILENARGQLYRAAGRDEAAELAFRTALEAAVDPDARVTIGVNLADTLLAMGRVLEAGEAARSAEETAFRAGNVVRLPEVYRVLGEVGAAREHADAFLFFERALEVIRERELPEVERAAVLEAYARHDEAAGHLESARERLREANELYTELDTDPGIERTRRLLDGVEAALENGEDEPI